MHGACATACRGVRHAACRMQHQPCSTLFSGQGSTQRRTNFEAAAHQPRQSHRPPIAPRTCSLNATALQRARPRPRRARGRAAAAAAAAHGRRCPRAPRQRPSCTTRRGEGRGGARGAGGRCWSRACGHRAGLWRAGSPHPGGWRCTQYAARSSRLVKVFEGVEGKEFRFRLQRVRFGVLGLGLG